MSTFKTLKIKLTDGDVGILALNRPQKGNAQNDDMWQELHQALHTLQNMGARAIVLRGEGKHFCTGIDLATLGGGLTSGAGADHCEGRARLQFMSSLKVLQDAMNAFERCPLPIVAAIHGACIGAGIDLITACDIRVATSDARFSVKEVDLGLAADMGTLARLPGIVGDGVARDLALTGREFTGADALRYNLVSQTLPTANELIQHVLELANNLAAKSPLALLGTKRMLLHQRGRTVKEGLDAVTVWNAATLPGSEDIKDVFKAMNERRNPIFSKL
jgi:enoyl-CoA hydratase/carnithine racemase